MSKYGSNLLFGVCIIGMIASAFVPLGQMVSPVSEPYRAYFWRVSFPFLLFCWYFLVTLIVVIAMRWPALARLSYQAVFWLVAIIAPLVGYAAVADVVQGGALCTSCWISYICAVGIFELTARMVRLTPPPPAPAVQEAMWRLFASTPIRAAAVVLIAIALSGAFKFGGRSPLRPHPGADTGVGFERWFLAQPRVDVPRYDSSPVQVLSFNDYLCPACRLAHQVLRAMHSTTPSDALKGVLFITRDFPLDTECNPTVDMSVHPLACEAAAAVRIARRVNRHEPLEDWLFEHQQQLTAHDLWDAAKRISGVSVTPKDYAEVLREIRADIDLGKQLDLNSVPVMFVNGVRIRGFLSQRQLEQAFQLERSFAIQTRGG